MPSCSPRRTIAALLGLSAAIVTMVAAVEVPVFASFVAVMIAAFTLARYSRCGLPLSATPCWSGLSPSSLRRSSRTAVVGVFGLIYPIFYFGGAGLLGWLTRKRAEHVTSLIAYAEVL